MKQKRPERKKVFEKQEGPGIDAKHDLWRRGRSSKNERPYIKLEIPGRFGAFVKQGVPGIYANRGLPALQRYWSLDKPLLFKGFWRSVQSPPATEVWFRCAPPHVASLINSVQDRRDLPLMSEGAAAASSCEAGPLSPGVRTQK